MFRWHPWTVVLLGAVSFCNVAQAQDDMLPPGDLPLPEVQSPEVQSPGVPLAKEGVYLPTRAWYGAANPPVGQATGGSYLGGTHIGSPYNWNGPGSAPVGAWGGTFGWTGYGWRGYGGNGAHGGGYNGGYNGSAYVGGGYAGYGAPSNPYFGGVGGYNGNAYVGDAYVGGGYVTSGILGSGTPYGAYGVNGPAGPSDPYVYHFGPGFHRHSNYGHYRFPYYNYRAPWYFSGSPSYNRDTNHPW